MDQEHTVAVKKAPAALETPVVSASGKPRALIFHNYEHAQAACLFVEVNQDGEAVKSMVVPMNAGSLSRCPATETEVALLKAGISLLFFAGNHF